MKYSLTSCYALVLLLLLVGCAGNNRDAMTIASLEPVALEATAPATPVLEKPALSFDAAIASYQRLLDLPGANPFRPQALQRLGDLNLNHGEQREVEDEQYNAETHYQRASQYYEQLIREYPDYEAIAMVYYQLARAYDKLGDVDASLAALDQVVRYDVERGVMAETQFRRGEILFVNAQFERSLSAYQAVVELGEGTGYYEQALLKYSWNLFKRDRFDDALVSFYRLLELKYQGVHFSEVDFQPQNLARADQELLRDTLRGMTLIFALKGDYAVMREFGELYSDPSYNHLIYEAVAGIYRDEGRYYDEADVLKAFIEAYPDSPKAAYFQYRLVDIYTSSGDVELLLTAKRDLINHYWLHEARWAVVSAPLKAKLRPAIGSFVQALAEYHHSRFQKQKSMEDYAAAQDWYQLYVSRFQDGEAVIEQHFLLAELQNQQQHFLKAAANYEQVAYGYELHDRSAEAGYAAILAFAAVAELAPQEDGQEVDTLALKQQSTLRFVSTFSADPRRPKVLMVLADESYQREQFDQARLAAFMLIDSLQAEADTHRYAAQMLLGHIAYQAQDYLQAESDFGQARDLVPAGTKRKLEAEDWLAISVYKQAELFVAQGESRKAVANFLIIQELAPSSKFAAQAVFDGASELIKLEDWDETVRVLQMFRTRYPNHELQKDVPHKLALAYMELDDYRNASAAFAEIAQRSTDVNERREASFESARLLEKAGEHERAGAAYKRFIYAHPNPAALAFKAKLALAAIYQSSGQLDKRDYWYHDIVKSSQKAELKDDTKVQFAAAEASFHLAERKYESFQTVQLVTPIQKNMTLKRTRMQEAMSAYETTAAYGYAEFVTAATHRIGDIYYQLGDALLNSERPQELNADELEQYELMLEEQAYPFEEKAIEILETNVARIDDGLFDQWVSDSIEMLGGLLPVQYQKPEQGDEVIHALH